MEPKTCPRCRTAVDAEDAAGLCPGCLLREGLEGASEQTAVPCAGCGEALGERVRYCPQCGTAAVGGPHPAGDDPVRAALEARLGGQYRLVRLLGRGGMGSVYLARDLTLEREVAIKVVKPIAGAPDLYDRFRREARTAAGLSHPNVVPLHAFGEVEGMPYFVMGYVRGESLAARLRRDGRLPEDDTRRILADVADALDHAHRQGVVHRDVKPDNVLLADESGRALLTDFGVAKAPGRGDTLTRAGGVLGTPHYMSPEQAAGSGEVDARSDLYSLGVMGYAMLAGRLPFDGATPVDVLRQHLTQEPAPLRSLAPTVGDSTLQAIERCLAKDPARRWPDARSLARVLGTHEEATLPDELQAVHGQGVLATAIAALLLVAVALFEPPPAILLLNAGFVVVVYLVALAQLWREGFPPSVSQRAIWTEPPWWPFWYPRRLRRPGNVWDRLPAAVRRARWSIPGLALMALLYFVDSVRLMPQGLVLLVTTLALFSLLEGLARRELKRRGLPRADHSRVLFSMPPSRVGFWSRPYVSAILAPAPEREAELEQRAASPHDRLQSILRHGNELSGPLRPLGAQAAVAARQLVAAIEETDHEIGELARHLEPGEEERLGARIEALAPASGADDTAPLRQLLEQQLELVRGLAARLEEARSRRERRVEMLRTLDLHLATLRARSVEPPTDLRSVSDRVQALCEDIARQASALHGAGSAVVVSSEAPTLEERR